MENYYNVLLCLQPVVGGGISLGGNASLSPRVASPNPDASAMLNPHILQQQSRLSPHSKFESVVRDCLYIVSLNEM